jgi:hypothetical protein
MMPSYNQNSTNTNDTYIQSKQYKWYLSISKLELLVSEFI